MENKQTLWIFGDSFSTPFNDNTLGTWDGDYCKWKGYVPKYFGDIIAKELEVNIQHFGYGGSDNDTIFESIIKQAPKINKGDLVIIGWSSIGRFRLVNRENKFQTVIPSFIDKSLTWFDTISKSTIEEILVNRDHYLYKKELYTKLEFLNFLFNDMKLIQWTPFNYDGTKILGFKDINTIMIETNGELKDGHYSEIGHIEVSKKFITMFNDDKLRNDSNRLYMHLI
jgi:hypothetical protein